MAPTRLSCGSSLAVYAVDAGQANEILDDVFVSYAG